MLFIQRKGLICFRPITEQFAFSLAQKKLGQKQKRDQHQGPGDRPGHIEQFLG